DFLGSGLRRDTSCLILDIRMPGMNGLQLQSNLSAEGCGIPIIFITAHDDKEPCRQAIQAGAVGFLGKPFSDVQLLQIIRSALQHSENRVTTEEYTGTRQLPVRKNALSSRFTPSLWGRLWKMSTELH